MKSLVWLASYPKSGNTWTRIFLANYLHDRQTPLPINDIRAFGSNDVRASFYRKILKGKFRTEDHRRHLSARPQVLKQIARGSADLNFLKSHNLNANIFGVDLIPAPLTASAVYIVRNPLDVVVSYSRHYGLSIPQTIASLGNRNNSTASSERNIKSFLGTWSQHALSWSGARGFPVLVQRYEDMQRNPHQTFKQLLRHLGLPADQDRLDRAVRFSSIGELQRQESESGFIERSSNADRFFHSGTSGQWKEQLTPDQIAQIREDHGSVMQKFGYF